MMAADEVLVEMGQVPRLVSVIGCVALVTLGGLLKLNGDVRLPESHQTPVPESERLMAEGELLALLSSTMLPVQAPSTVGVKLTTMVQDAPGAGQRGKVHVPPVTAKATGVAEGVIVVTVGVRVKFSEWHSKKIEGFLKMMLDFISPLGYLTDR